MATETKLVNINDVPYDRYFYDDDNDIKFMKWLNEGPEALSIEQQLAFAAIDWEWCMHNPRFIGLPCVIYFAPKRENPFPTGRLWGILMTYNYYGPRCKPRHDGIVFICGNQYVEPPRQCTYYQLYKWAIDPKNVPESCRFYSLAYALKIVCGKGGLWETKGNRSDGHFHGTKSWYIDEYDISIETCLKENIEFLESDDVLPPHLTPTKPRMIPRNPQKTGRKRKKTDNIDIDNLVKSVNWDELNLPSLSIPTIKDD
jgi:hypothetical protein